MPKMGVILDDRRYNIMINGYCKIEMVDQCMHLYQEMRHKNIIPTTVTFNTLINGLCQSGRTRDEWELFDVMLDEAFELVKEIKDNGIQFNLYTYTILVDDLCKGQRLEDAQLIFHDLLDKKYHLDVNIFTVMINGFCKELDEALALKLKMDESGCPNAVTFDTILRALCGNNEIEKAKKLFHEMMDRGISVGQE